MKELIKYLCFIIILLTIGKSFSQNAKIDSLLKALKTNKEDTNKVKTLCSLSRQLIKAFDYVRAKKFANDALILSSSLPYGKSKVWKNGQARAYTLFGLINWYQENYPESIKNYLLALEIYKESRDEEMIVYCYTSIALSYRSNGNGIKSLEYYTLALELNKEKKNKSVESNIYYNVGNIYYDQGNYPEALTNYLASLKIKEESKDKNGVAFIQNGLGGIYEAQGNYFEALKSRSAALKIFIEIGDKISAAYTYLYIGSNYVKQGMAGSDKEIIKNNYSKASENYSTALRIGETLENKTIIASYYNNIGIINLLQSNYVEALKNSYSGLKIKEQMGDSVLIADSYSNIGTIYLSLNNYAKAKKNVHIALSFYLKTLNRELIKANYKVLAAIDSAEGNYKNAYKNYKFYNIYKDSLLNEENTKKIVQTQMNYEFDKKEAITDIEHKKELENQQAIAEEKSRKQKIVIWASLLVVLIVVAFAGFVFRSLRITRRQKLIIEIKSKETEVQKMVIEAKNKDIIDSINYAQRIQNSLMPSEKYIDQKLKKLQNDNS